MGLTRYRFEWQAQPEETITLEPGEDTRTSFAAHFGAGARWEHRRLTAEVGVEDLVTWPDRPDEGSEHAVAVLAGLGLRVR